MSKVLVAILLHTEQNQQLFYPHVHITTILN